MASLTWEDGAVKIDGQEIPGILDTQSVDGKVRFDEQDVDGASGMKRTPLGWEDTVITLALVLTTDPGEDGRDCYEKLEAINTIFRGHDNKANPKVYDVDNRHLAARGVGRLIFSGLMSDESETDDTVYAVLTFTEHNPPVVKTEMAVAKSAHQAALDAKKTLEAQSKIALPEINPGVTVSMN
jgi:hypothetical protein